MVEQRLDFVTLPAPRESLHLQEICRYQKKLGYKKSVTLDPYYCLVLPTDEITTLSFV
jgi:hypothetical protein